MDISPIIDANSDFYKVHIINGTPHCKIHGAMNKMTKFEGGGGYWRCISSVSKLFENNCRAACQQSDKIYTINKTRHDKFNYKGI